MKNAELIPFPALGKLLSDPNRIATEDGVEARVRDGGQVLQVTAPGGEVLFTYSVRTGQATVHTKGDLRLASESGNVEIHAREAVRIEGGKKVQISTEETELESARVRANVGEGRFSLREAIFSAERIDTAVQVARTIAGVMELRAGRMVERLRDSFREVEGLSQTRAERVRVVAKDAFQVQSHRATIKAEDDLALMGEKIHLA
jgi:hypothetical protein